MKNRVVKIIFGVSGVILLSRVLGFVREMVIADKFGTSAEYDLYLIAIMLPALLYGVINFAAVYLFVPYLSKKKSEEASLCWRDIWPSLNLTIILSLALAVLIYILAPFIMKIWGGEYSNEDFSKIVFYSRITAIMLLLGTTEAFMRAYLNVKKIFVYPAAGYIVYNIFCILGIVLFYQQYSTGAIVIGLLGGFTVQNIYLLLKILKFNPFAEFNPKILNDDTRAILSTGGVIILIELINRSYFLLDRYFALPFGDGVISGLNYSQVLVQLPDSIIGFAIGAVLFPYFSDASQNINDNRFGEVYQKTITGAVFIAVPIAVFFYVNAWDLVFLLFQRGEFDWHSVEITATILKPYSVSIIALFIISTSIRAAYSAGWTKQILFFAIIIFIVKVCGNFVLPKFFGYAGISMATSAALVSMALLMVILLIKKTRDSDSKLFIITALKLIVIYLLSLVILSFTDGLLSEYFNQSNHIEVIIKLIISGLSLLILYVILSYLFGLRKVYHNLLIRKRSV